MPRTSGHRKVTLRGGVRAGRGQGPWEQREAPNPARPPVCELHVHPDCVPFACSDCRECQRDGHRDHVSAQGLGAGGGGAEARRAC